jgi:hypothetical protein
VLSEPDWPEIHRYYAPEAKSHREEGQVPMLFTSKDGAVTELRYVQQESNLPTYVQAVEAVREGAAGVK